MRDTSIQMIFGWPAIIMSILLSVGGVWLKNTPMLVVAGIVIIPFTYYLSGFGTPALILPFFQFGSAYAVSRQKIWLAWLLIAPLIIISLLLASAVLTQ